MSVEFEQLDEQTKLYVARLLRKEASWSKRYRTSEERQKRFDDALSPELQLAKQLTGCDLIVIDE